MYNNLQKGQYYNIYLSCDANRRILGRRIKFESPKTIIGMPKEI